MSANNASASISRMELLSKDNYDTWAMQVEALLVKNDLWDFVSGVSEMPEEDGFIKASWLKNDKKAKADLVLAIHPSELKQIRGCDTSHQVWSKLESIYASKGPARKATLLKQLIMHKLEEGNDVKDHISKFFDAVDKLENMDVKIDGDLLSIMLLYSLPASFENFRCAIESRDKLPDAESLKIKIIEESDARKQSPTGTVIAMAATHSRHDVVHKNSNKSYFKCFKCGTIGHKASACPLKKVRNKPNEKRRHNNVTETFYVSLAEDNAVASCSTWILDSGCTMHMCGHQRYFRSVANPSKLKINLASQACADVRGQGLVQLNLEINGSPHSVNLQDTLYVPDLRTNLISVTKIADKGYKVIFDKNKACVYNTDGSLSLVADRRGELYYVREFVDCAAAESKCSEFLKWHWRLGHLNAKDMVKLMHDGILPNMNKDLNSLTNCQICHTGKMAALPFNKMRKPCNEILNIVYSDVVGPFRTRSMEGARYFVTFIDDSSRWCEVYFLSDKSGVFNAFKIYKQFMEKHTGKVIKYLHSDNGREYINNNFDSFLLENGIQRRLTIPHTPQQNGVAERFNRTLLDMSRCLLLQAGLSPCFWSTAVATACYVRNRCPTSALNFLTPYEKLYGQKPMLKGFKTYGCKVVVLDKDPTKYKLAPRGIEGFFVGYAKDHKGYRIWLPDARRFTFSRDVKFMNEDIAKTSIDQDETADPIMIEIVSETSKTSFPGEPHQIRESEALVKRAPGRPRLVKTGGRGRPRKQYHEVTCESEGNQAVSDEVANTIASSSNNVNDNAVVVDDNAVVADRVSAAGDDRAVEVETDVFYDIDDGGVVYAGIAEVNLKDALNGADSDEWLDAIESEVASLLKNDTWDIVKLSGKDDVIGCRFVLTNKCKSDGSIERRKARLVARGYSQRYGINYNETFAPVARLETLRLMLALSVRYGFSIWQVDIVTAYLHGNLNEHVLMKLPDMLHIMLKRILRKHDHDSVIGARAMKMLQKLNGDDNVCLLKKALYGLKQAGRQWYLKLSNKLRQLGLHNARNESCLFFGKYNNETVFLLVYVDDILICSRDELLVQNLKTELSKEFELKDLGLANYCLGLEINQTGGNIILNQTGYINEVLKQYGMENCNPVLSPAESNLRFDNIADPCDEGKYRQLIGSLMYISVSTRPDISNVVARLAQYVNKPNNAQWNAAKRVLRYLAGTKKKSLMYKRNSSPVIAYADSDWGGNLVDRRSYSGYVFILSGGAISWKSQKQRTVALSSTEAEYISLAEAAKEALYLRSLLIEIGSTSLANITIFVDNKGAEFLASNPVFHARTKHIDIRHHFVREAVEEKFLEIQHIPTQKMAADILTKPVSRVIQESCLKLIGLV